jgi:hypothetical protein
MNKPFMRMWGAVMLIGLLTTIGLLSALLGDGVWDLVSAIALSVPVIVASWLGLMKRTGGEHRAMKTKQC